MIRWEWAGDHAAFEQPVAAMLSPRLGDAQVRRIVELLYASLLYQPEEMLRAAQQHGSFNPYTAKLGSVSMKVGGEIKHVPWGGEVVCGHNPWLTARKARVWALGDGSGNVGWEDDERP